MVAIPVFPSRVFRHGYIAIDKRQVIETPKDLAGKRIGVPLYAMTAAIFIRGLLQHDHGVDLSGVTWVEGGINDTKPHGAPLEHSARAQPVAIEPHTQRACRSTTGWRPATSPPSSAPACRRRSRRNPNIARLFPDYRAREMDYFRRTRIFPIMHLVVIRRDVYEKHPFVATSLFNAFCEAKAIAAKKMRELGTLRYMLPWMAAEIEEIDAGVRRRSLALRHRAEPGDARSAGAISRRSGADREAGADRRAVRADLRPGSEVVSVFATQLLAAAVIAPLCRRPREGGDP